MIGKMVGAIAMEAERLSPDQNHRQVAEIIMQIVRPRERQVLLPSIAGSVATDDIWIGMAMV